MKRLIVSLSTLLVGSAIAACSAPSTPALSPTNSGTSNTDATSPSGMQQATTEATGPNSTEVATTGAASSRATSSATTGTIFDVAGQQGNFTTLVAALQASGLDKQLSAAGEYTVFAPTDAAFAALPSGTVQALLANPTLLSQILSYHVTQGSLTAADVSSATSISTIEGQPIAVSASNGIVTLNGEAKVTSSDIQTSNGVIHVIDKVLLPPGVTLP